MNWQQRENKNRPWLREELFVITKDLNDYLAVNKELTEEERRKLAIIQHTVLRGEDSPECDYIHVHSREWKRLVGSDYRHWIDYLAAIEGLRVNESYSAESNEEYDAFTKSYLIPRFSRRDEADKLALARFKAPVPRYTDRSDLCDALSDHVFESLKELTIKETLNEIEHPARRAFGLQDCKKMYRGCFNVSYGANSYRLGHVVIRMVREARRNLKFKYSDEKLICCDITSCFPNLIPVWMQDEKEKSAFLKVLEGDFYENLIEEIGTKKTRDQIKKDVLVYLCDSNPRSGSRLDLWFKKQLPHFSEWKSKQDQMALMLQNKEAGIINELGKYCVRKKIWFVPMYDGFLCREAHQSELKKECESIFRTQIGHNPQITTSVLGG